MVYNMYNSKYVLTVYVIIGKASNQQEAISSYVWGESKVLEGFSTAQGVSAPNPRAVQRSTVYQALAGPRPCSGHFSPMDSNLYLSTVLK